MSEPTMPVQAPKYSINLHDFVKGLIVITIYSALTALTVILSNGAFPTLAQDKTIGLSALGVGISYIIKNLLTSSNDKFLGKEPIKTIYNYPITDPPTDTKP